MHGYLSSSDSFYYQKDFFKRYFNAYFLDLKGFGKNKEMPFAYNLQDYANEVKEFAYKNGIIKPHLIAHSFGARVAVKILSTDMNFADKLVITGGAGLKPKFSLKKFCKKSTFNLLKKFVDKEKLSCFYSKDYLALSPVLKKSFVKIINENLDDKLSLILNKTLLIYGSLDKETPLYMAKRFNKGLINSSLSVYKNAGHFCFIDMPQKFNMEVREFLLSK